MRSNKETQRTRTRSPTDCKAELTDLAARLDEESNSELAATLAPIASALDQATSLSGLGELRTITEETPALAIPFHQRSVIDWSITSQPRKPPAAGATW